MRLPIQYALMYPQKLSNPKFRSLDLAELSTLTFKKMDFERFPALGMAYQAGKAGGLMPAVFNAANEVAVSLFLKGKIKFLEIEDIIEEALESFENQANPTLEEILAADSKVRTCILEKYEVK